MVKIPKNNKSSKKENKEKEEINNQLDKETKKGITVIIIFAIAAVSLLSIFSLAGKAGVQIDKLLYYIFGYAKYLFPIILVIIGYLLIFPDKYKIKLTNYFGVALFIMSACSLLDIIYNKQIGGGRLGLVFSYPLIQISTVWVALIVVLAIFIASLLLMLNTSLANLLTKFPATSFLGKAGHLIYDLFNRAKDGISRKRYEYADTLEEEVEEETEIANGFASKEIADKNLADPSKKIEPEQMQLIPTKKFVQRKMDIPLSLLNNKNEKPTSGDIESNKEKIHHTLASFGIETTMGDISVGPTVTQYTLKPAEGVKLSQIVTLSNDLALSLAAHPIRIEAPIPGKSLVGIEVPNEAVAMVGLKELMLSDAFKKRKSSLALCIGRDVSGDTFLADLGPMPHLLIAGSTGSGKSVCINALIVSLLYQNGPDDMKLILVDPKRVEFSLYNGIPHLLTPVITDVQKTINALKWVVNEMDRRYELLSQAGKRNIKDYNATGNHMPYIVLVIDELADLMSTAAREVEAAIIRLAQMARAVGIHLILATQRPSVDVITGLIKANITARIAFNVASLIDSRTILDHSGAEKLIGKGDMLFINSTLGKPKRLQGALLSEDEIERVVQYLKSKAQPQYDAEIVERQAKGIMPQAYQDGESEDELLLEAKDIIMQAKKASASLLQRRLRVGYARAARILDILEEQGFIGPADGAKPREILVSEVVTSDNIEEEDDEEAEEANAKAIEKNNE